MSEQERHEPQLGFRVRDEADKTQFVDALKKQYHIANATVFFQSAMDALKAASDRGELVEWPLEFVTKSKKKIGRALSLLALGSSMFWQTGIPQTALISVYKRPSAPSGIPRLIEREQRSPIDFYTSPF